MDEDPYTEQPPEGADEDPYAEQPPEEEPAEEEPKKKPMKFHDSRLDDISGNSESTEGGAFRDTRADALKKESFILTLDDIGKQKSPFAKDTSLRQKGTSMMDSQDIDAKSSPLWKPQEMGDITILGKDDDSLIKKKLKHYTSKIQSGGWLKAAETGKQKAHSEPDTGNLKTKGKKSVARYIPKRRL